MTRCCALRRRLLLVNNITIPWLSTQSGCHWSCEWRVSLWDFTISQGYISRKNECHRQSKVLGANKDASCRNKWCLPCLACFQWLCRLAMHWNFSSELYGRFCYAASLITLQVSRIWTYYIWINIYLVGWTPCEYVFTLLQQAGQMVK